MAVTAFQAAVAIARRPPHTIIRCEQPVAPGRRSFRLGTIGNPSKSFRVPHGRLHLSSPSPPHRRCIHRARSKRFHILRRQTLAAVYLLNRRVSRPRCLHKSHPAVITTAPRNSLSRSPPLPLSREKEDAPRGRKKLGNAAKTRVCARARALLALKARGLTTPVRLKHGRAFEGTFTFATGGANLSLNSSSLRARPHPGVASFSVTVFARRRQRDVVTTERDRDAHATRKTDH